MLERILTILIESIELKKHVLSDTETINNVSQCISEIIRAYQKNKKVILMGNGGSAADAQHLAAEFVGRFRLTRRSLTAIALHCDTSVVTALANDFGYEDVFSRQIESLANEGDVVIALSTSGNSQNIYKGLSTAKEKCCFLIGLLGNGGGKIAPLCDVALIVPSDNTPRIQEVHILLGHIICELVELGLFQGGMNA